MTSDTGLWELPCTPDDPCDEAWELEDHDYYVCGFCGRLATPEEAESESERRFDRSLPDMTGYQEQ